MRTVEQALALVSDAAGEPRRRVERVPVEQGLARVLAEDVCMDHDVPPFRRAMMDGFAAQVGDVVAGRTLDVVGEVVAGVWPEGVVGPGQAVRIMTGAPVPTGADYVVPFEWTTADADRVTIDEVVRGPNIVERGEHTRAGVVVAAAGTALSPGALGALASAGAAELAVAARPTVAILGTGTELVPVDATPGPGAIRNSNGSTLVGQVLRAGGEPRDLGIAPDDEGALRAKIRAGLDADLLLLSGGVSKGVLDLVPDALAAEGVVEVFHRWSVQPGGPLWFGTRGDTLVFGLPGNPAATFTGFELLAVPALQTRLGLPFAPRPTLKARFEGEWGRPGPRRRYRPVALEVDPTGVLIAVALDWRGSGDPFPLARAEGLATLLEETPRPADGLVDIVPLGAPAAAWVRP